MHFNNVQDLTEGILPTFQRKRYEDKFFWNEGHPLVDIYNVLRKRDWERTYDEVCLLIFDLSRKGEIKKRPNGIQDNI
ncbi:hypothetical protein BKP45_13615 [Anaerobacillus alkalidiazotrophicus]|uniref:Uncharacterized protein n=1 Tax=Anaerobacillus alkalidiazotrophicus TaxID=472963 RepID=A0A1S2M3N0_9BACI|nr:hypothetical protein [Anaerobacillus alkalidiazotrophicus]OIJ19196.1 hypothetical protein BKP45_13615 [Anaerobacillus alkalidiazotrophicus]